MRRASLRQRKTDMRFLSVAERELRAAARRRATYRARWITAVVFFGLLVWLLWAFDGFRNRRAAPEVFQVFAALTFVYCLIIGTATTADCLSSEKREGTLGLLFLTNLSSLDIIAGKLCSSALAAAYGLFAIFPMLALPLLMGGITFEHFWKTILALANSILFSVAAGFLASVVCVRQFTAVALASGLVGVISGGLMIAAALADSFGATKFLAPFAAIFSPLYALMGADGRRGFSGNQYWLSLGTVAGVSWTWLALVTWRLARTWRDRPKNSGAWSRMKFWSRWCQPGSARRVALRRRLLEINPFFWLDGRRLVSAPVFMALMIGLVAVASLGVAPLLGRIIRGGNSTYLIGSVFTWFWTGVAVHALVLYYAAMAASQRLAEDKQSGALELILSTPTNDRILSLGLWLAYARRMLFPATAAVLAHFFFLWQAATLVILEPPQERPLGITPGQLLWHLFLNRPIPGWPLEWGFAFALHILLLALVLFVVTWITLGWVGRWLGLRMKHPGFAPMVSLALVLIPPIILFSLVCYLCDVWELYRMPNHQFYPLIMWVAFAIGAGHCLLLSAWAATRLRRDLRTTVTSRFQPPRTRFWWFPSRRTVFRFAFGAGALAAIIAAIIFCFYGYQNWRSRRDWIAFRQQLKQRGESLDVSPLLPGPVPDGENFARAPAFRNLLSRSNGTARLLDQMSPQSAAAPFANNPAMIEWARQRVAPLDTYAILTAAKSSRAAGTNRTDYASAVLQGLQPHREAMRAVAEAAWLPCFQTATNRNALVVLQADKGELMALEELHLLFQVRACASLAAGRRGEAGEDLLTGLRLARLARQSPDVRASMRVQVMLTCALQPLWEGLATRQWNEAQLAAFQNELARFDLLADHTNAIRRVVLANIEIWRAIPDAATNQISVPAAGDGNVYRPAWQAHPRAWWFDNCIQLHQIGQRAIENVDVAGARVRVDFNWSDLNGLPLDNEASQLLQQAYWWGANPSQVSFAQNSVNQAILACALERFRLANGKLPQNLEQLIPTYLDRIPNDIVRGRPMTYQYIDPDRFILRGVGPNEVDDRKTPASDDWLWSYPTNSPPAAK